MAILLYIYIILQVVSFENLFGTMIFVLGYPIPTWVVYGLYFITIIYTFFFIVLQYDRKGKLPLVFLFFITIIVISTYSAMQGTSVLEMMNRSVRYVLPVLLYVYLFEGKYKYKTLIAVIEYSIVLCAIIGLLFMTGVLSHVVNTSYLSQLSRSSTIIDGGYGLIAIAIGLYCLFYESELLNKRNAQIVLVSGIIIVVSGQSRARILTAVLVVALFFLMTKFGKSNKEEKRFSWIRFVLIALVAVLVLTLVAPNILNSVSSQIMNRFVELGVDNSSIYRVYERQEQLRIFYQSPIIGGGWGGMIGKTVEDTYGTAKYINNHNMYTTILALGGILLAVNYILWFGSLLIQSIRNFRIYSEEKLHILIFIIILIMSFSSAGFGKTSMTVGMIVIYANLMHRKRESVCWGIYK